MRYISRLFTILLLLLSSQFLNAQTDSSLGNTMRSNGRIYVVVAVILVILAGLFLYLVRLDRKMSKLEKNN
jgi:cytochrome bd-type quinol oxidase subunit 2